jgi:predicted acylesterase/phospholipase RssA
VLAGTSSGSVLAALLAQGADRDEQRAALDDVERIWREMSESSHMYEETPWYLSLRTIAPEWLEVFSRRRRPGRAVGIGRPHGRDAAEEVDPPPDARMWSPFRTVDALLAMRALGRTGRDLENVLVAAESAQGLFVPGQVTTRLADPAVFRPERVAASGVRLRIAVVGLESGELRYVTEDGGLVDRENHPLPTSAPIGLADAVRASSAIPVVFPPVVLDGETYVDGGVREVVPVEMAARHLGATHCYAVVASAGGITPDSGFAGRNILAIASRAYADIMWDEVLRDEIELARASASVTVIQPEVDVHDSLSVDPGLIAIAIDYGWLRAADVVTRADGWQLEVTRRIVTLRRQIWELENAVGAPDAPGGDGPPAERVGELASLKGELRDVVGQKTPEHLPDGADRWHARWEGHTWATPPDILWRSAPEPAPSA